MYRLVIVVCLVAGLVSGKCGTQRKNSNSGGGGGYWSSGGSSNRGRGGGYWSRKDTSFQNSLEVVEEKLVEVDNKMDAICSVHSDRTLREVYGMDRFQLRVSLREFSEDDIQVRVRQRLVSIHAQDCSTEYAAVRILPDIVDPARAVWKFNGSELAVLFPYDITPNKQVQSYCGRDVSDNVIIVPKCGSGVKFERDYDLALGNERLKTVIKRLIKELYEKGEINDSSVEYFDD